MTLGDLWSISCLLYVFIYIITISQQNTDYRKKVRQNTKPINQTLTKYQESLYPKWKSNFPDYFESRFLFEN